MKYLTIIAALGCIIAAMIFYVAKQPAGTITASMLAFAFMFAANRKW